MIDNKKKKQKLSGLPEEVLHHIFTLIVPKEVVRIDNKKTKQELDPKTTTSENEKEEDRMSGLPEEVLHHILTLVSPKEALRMRVLSKRWKSLWTSLPVLDFGEGWPYLWPDFLKRKTLPSSSWQVRKREPSDRALMNFLDFFFTNRNHNTSIQKLSLYCNENFDTHRIHSWLSYLVTHTIQHLTLVLHLDRFAFPCSLFTCNSLKDLRLEMSCIFNLPTTTSATTTSFPSLKSLCLKYIKFFRKVHVDRLLSNCPVLEELYFHDCLWMNVHNIKISAPALKILCIIEDTCNSPFALHTCEVDIFAPNITTFVFMANFPKRLGFSSLPFLHHAIINPYIPDRLVREMNIGVQNRVMSILQPISKVQHLEIERDIGQILFLDQHLLPHFPTFHQLITLQLDWFDDTLLTTTLLNILRIMPNLQALYIQKGACHHIDDDSSSLPQCMLLHLRSIEIRKIQGNVGELDMIKFLLKNATALEEMIVTIDNSLETERVDMVVLQLRMFPIISLQGCINITLE